MLEVRCTWAWQGGLSGDFTMITFTCDLCSDPCPSTPNRRWTHIAGTTGLEVIILDGEKPSGDRHLCDGCLCDLFKLHLDRVPNQKIRESMVAFAEREAQLTRRGLTAEREQAVTTVRRLYRRHTLRLQSVKLL